MIFFVSIPEWILPVAILSGVILIAGILLAVIPALRGKKKEETKEEIVLNEVKQIVVVEDKKANNQFKNDYMAEYDKIEIEKKEKELNLVFNDIEVESLLSQMAIDRQDND